VLEVGQVAQRAGNGVDVVVNHTGYGLPIAGEVLAKKLVDCGTTLVLIHAG
jgi:UDP-N-acetyl-D-mannosaminuronic acid transferase (WecB/TagA/CpsF family)